MANELSLNELTLYDLYNVIDKQQVKIRLEQSITSFFATFLITADKELGQRLKEWIDWYSKAVETLDKVKILEVDQKMVNFLRSDEFQKILNETEPLASIQDELQRIMESNEKDNNVEKVPKVNYEQLRKEAEHNTENKRT